MTFTIKPARFAAWGYEITAKGYRNTAPSVKDAVNFLYDRFGADIRIKIKDSGQDGKGAEK